MSHPKSGGPTSGYKKHTDDSHKRLEAIQALRKKKLPILDTYISQQIPNLLNAWQEQVDAALNRAKAPVEEESHVFWYIALVGNMIWAFTCFVNPEAKAIIKIMSVVGAAVAAGGVQKMSFESPPLDGESAKGQIEELIVTARGGLEEYFQTMSREWASGFFKLQDWEEGDGSVVDLFRAYMWGKMFPGVKFDADRYKRIYAEALKLMQYALADYNRQWQEYQKIARMRHAFKGIDLSSKFGVEKPFRPKLNIHFANTAGPDRDFSLLADEPEPGAWFFKDDE